MRQYYRMFRANVLQRLIPKSRHAFVAGGPVEVAGYFSMTAGVAESARLCVDALAREGIPVRIADVGRSSEQTHNVEWARPALASGLARTRILHLNPPMLPGGLARLGVREFLKTYNIGYWAWELEVVPAEWKNALRYVNAAFVPSEFTRKAIASHSAVPVIVVPHPVAEKPAASGIRAQFGIPDDAFLVSNVFSASSSMNRKNPAAVLHAFRQLAASHPKAHLLMKASGNPAKDEGLRALLAAAGDMSNVRIITDNLPSSVISGIIGQSDAYVSLHRSEGFGLTVAEAILAGTPVVSTGWSGTVAFCDPENTWNTEYRLIPVVDNHPEFVGLPNARWADADAGHAGRQLQEIAESPWNTARRAAGARLFLERYLKERTYKKALELLAAVI